MKVDELKKALRQVDPAAVLVSQRLLARVIQEVHHLPATQFLQVPHQRSFVIDRQVLFRHVEQDELDVDPDRMLPTTVVLLVRPSSADGDVQDRAATLLYYWQRLFHASVDRTLEQKTKDGGLTKAEVDSRIAAIGEAEFDEIRGVLARDRWLLPPVDDSVVYREFAAVYLELRYFLPNLRSVYFPALRDLAKIDAIIARDVDADSIWKATRPAGAADPKVRGDIRSDDSHEYYLRLVRAADAAAQAKNHVRAAILRIKAARVAPGMLTISTRAAAQTEMEHLTKRLISALQLPQAEASEWQRALESLLEKADQGHWTVEARLLYDLQQVCIDFERDVFKLDLVEWVLSFGKRPIKRPLPSQRLVQMTRHLNAAAQRIPLARLSDNDRQHLTGLLQAALQLSEQHLRARFRPMLADAFHDAGLSAGNPPEETAFQKMIEEVLDRIIAAGFFTFGDLRDVISRNSLKLPDLADPQEFVRGDPLLRLDRRLATLLDGVYRSGEIYLRVLERSTSLTYGTKAGRFVTRNVLLPFGGALLGLLGLELILSLPLSAAGLEITLAPLYSFIPLGLFILGVMHIPQMRAACHSACEIAADAGRLAFYGPVWLVRLPAVQRIWRSWFFQLLWWYIIKPLAFALPVGYFLVWLFAPHYDNFWVSFGIGFAVSAIVLNSRPGQAASEIVVLAILELYDKLRSGLIPGLVRLVMQVLKRAMDGLERVLYSIDEWLRFRSGDTQASLVVRTVLGVLWYPIAFLTRLYVVVFIEPMFHPLKLPIAILAAKLMIPIYPAILDTQIRVLAPIFGAEIAGLIAVVNAWLSADLFGFMFWELRENWRLYRANRAPALKPVMVGTQGETVLQLLKPGFHGGTLPRLFNHLRAAERTAMASGQWRQARAYRKQLHDVEKSVRLFVDRELLALLFQSRSWADQPLTLAKIELATQLIRLDFDHQSFPGEIARWALAQKAGWLTVQIECPGWLSKLSPRQRETLAMALAGWYKLAGIDVVREQLEPKLAAGGISYALEDDGLWLRTIANSDHQVVWPLRDTTRLQPLQSYGDGGNSTTLPSLEELVFARMSIEWETWVHAWQREKHGQAPLLLPADLTLLPPIASAPIELSALARRNGDEALQTVETAKTPSAG